MEHEMRLSARPYEAVRAGRKRFEIRLMDEKRQRIKVGDTIRFTRLPETAPHLRVTVLGLRQYATFEELYRDIPLRDIDCEGWTVEELVRSTYEIYTSQQELQFGALAIEIEVIP